MAALIKPASRVLNLQKTNSNLMKNPFKIIGPPKFLTDLILNRSQENSVHQYSRSYGNLQLAETISDIYSRKFSKKLDYLNEVLIVGGSSSGFYNMIQGMVNPGDDIILFEPNTYKTKSVIQVHGGKIKSVNLIKQENKWTIDFKKLKEICNEKTSLIVISSPHIPTGKIFTIEEMEKISELLLKYKNLKILFDARYETNILNGTEIALLPNINKEIFWERSVFLFGADKMFYYPDLNVGWVIGPANLLKFTKYSHNISIFCMYTPLQTAVQTSLIKSFERYENESNYHLFMSKFLKNKFEKMNEFLNNDLELGYQNQQIYPEGGWSYFYNYKDNLSNKQIEKLKTFENFENVDNSSLKWNNYSRIEYCINID